MVDKFFLLQVTGEEANLIGESLSTILTEEHPLIVRLQKQIAEQDAIYIAATRTDSPDKPV